MPNQDGAIFEQNKRGIVARDNGGKSIEKTRKPETRGTKDAIHSSRVILLLSFAELIRVIHAGFNLQTRAFEAEQYN